MSDELPRFVVPPRPPLPEALRRPIGPDPKPGPEGQSRPPQAGVKPDAPVKPPVIPRRVTRQTPDGKEIVVEWIDHTKLVYKDRYGLLFNAPVGGAVCLAFAEYLSLLQLGDGLRWAGMGLIGAGLALWVYKYGHELARETQRSVTFRPNGEVQIDAPVYGPAHKPGAARSMTVARGAERISSIEYTKTAEWSIIDDKAVVLADHWYDVHFFFDDEMRVSVSRSFASRDHAHALTALLVKAHADAKRLRAARSF